MWAEEQSLNKGLLLAIFFFLMINLSMSVLDKVIHRPDHYLLHLDASLLMTAASDAAVIREVPFPVSNEIVILLFYFFTCTQSIIVFLF